MTIAGQGIERELPVWLDGLGGQEDELDDVAKGKLDPPTDDEGPRGLVEKNDPSQENSNDTLEDLERKAGLRPM